MLEPATGGDRYILVDEPTSPTAHLLWYRIEGSELIIFTDLHSAYTIKGFLDFLFVLWCHFLIVCGYSCWLLWFTAALLGSSSSSSSIRCCHVYWLLSDGWRRNKDVCWQMFALLGQISASGEAGLSSVTVPRRKSPVGGSGEAVFFSSDYLTGASYDYHEIQRNLSANSDSRFLVWSEFFAFFLLDPETVETSGWATFHSREPWFTKSLKDHKFGNLLSYFVFLYQGTITTSITKSQNVTMRDGWLSSFFVWRVSVTVWSWFCCWFLHGYSVETILFDTATNIWQFLFVVGKMSDVWTHRYSTFSLFFGLFFVFGVGNGLMQLWHTEHVTVGVFT